MNSDFNFLGLAKRANALYIGQDKVLAALRDTSGVYILVSNDISPTLMRKIEAKKNTSRDMTIIATNLSRLEIGSILGIKSSSILAIRKTNPFAKKIKQIDILQNNN